MIDSVASSGAGAACVVFFAEANSRGTLLCARSAVRAGLPVCAFAAPGVVLPSLIPGGSWLSVAPSVPVSSCWRDSFLWCPPSSDDVPFFTSEVLP